MAIRNGRWYGRGFFFCTRHRYIKADVVVKSTIGYRCKFCGARVRTRPRKKKNMSLKWIDLGEVDE